MIKVIFNLCRNAPLNIKPVEYFVNVEDYNLAEDLAFEELKKDIDPQFLKYYVNGDTVMCYLKLLG